MYNKPPWGYPALPPGIALKLKKALYGLKQSILDKYLNRDLKMTCLNTDLCFYVRFAEDRSQYLMLQVYVDDLIIAGSTQATVDTFKSQFLRRFQCKAL